jgi:hypothetical protein
VASISKDDIGDTRKSGSEARVNRRLHLWIRLLDAYPDHGDEACREDGYECCSVSSVQSTAYLPRLLMVYSQAMLI